eukprot:4991131-Amphidinium_carterae.1
MLKLHPTLRFEVSAGRSLNMRIAAAVVLKLSWETTNLSESPRSGKTFAVEEQSRTLCSAWHIR